MRNPVQLFHQKFEVRGSRPAASTHDRDVVFGHEFVQVIGERFRLERIDSLTIHVERQTGIGDARNGQGGIFAEDADGLAHVLGSGGAVEADDIDAHAFEDGERGVDIGAEQHATGGIERDLRLDGQIDLGLVEGLVDADDGGFDFEDVLRGFDEQHIHAAADQTDGLLAEDIDEFVEVTRWRVRGHWRRGVCRRDRWSRRRNEADLVFPAYSSARRRASGRRFR